MASRLADFNQAIEASGGGGGEAPKNENKIHTVLNNPPNKYGNQTSRVVGTFGKRLTISRTNI